jgi:hypothetical protein
MFETQRHYECVCRMSSNYVTITTQTTRSSGKNFFAYFPHISNLFEVLESNLMELNLSELTLTSFNLT